MASKNEATVTFKAETSEFTQNINDANNTIKNLNSDLKLTDTQLKNGGDATELYAQKSQILQTQLDANQQKQEALTQKLEVAKSIYGEDSTEVQKLESSLNYAQIQEENLTAKLEECNAQLFEAASATANLSPEMQDLQATIADQEAELTNLQSEYANAVSEFGATSDEAQNLASQIDSLSGELAANQAEFDSVTGAAGETTDALANTADETGGNLYSAMEGFANLEMADKFKEIADNAFEMADGIAEAAGIIAQGTGATGDNLDEFTEQAVAAYSSVADSSQDLNTVSDALAELNTRWGLTGDELDSATDSVLKYSKATGTDAKTAVDDLADVMKRWGLDSSDLDSTMDKLTVAAQASGVSVTELSSQLSSGSVSFSELGLSMDDSLAYMAQWANNGASLSSITTGMRQAVNQFSAAGVDVPSSFQEAIATIENAEDASSALSAEVGDTGLTVKDVFGSKAAQEIVNAVQSTEGGVDDMSDAIANSGGVMEQTYEDTITAADAFSQLKNTISTCTGSALQPLIGGLTKILTAISTFISEHPAVQKAISVIVTAISALAGVLAISATIKGVTSALGGLKTAIGGVNSALSIASGPIGIIITLAGILIPLFISLYQNCEPFRNFVDNCAQLIQGAFLTALNGLKTALQTVANFFKRIAEVVQTVIGAFGDFISGAKNLVKGAKEKFANLKQNVVNVFGKIKEKIVGAATDSNSESQGPLQKLKKFYSTIGGAIKTVASSKFSAVKEAVVNKVSAMKESAGQKLSALKETFSSAGSTIKETFVGKFSDIKEAVIEKVTALKEKISGIIETIKGFFDFTTKTPNIKLPHFSITPTGWKLKDLLEGTIPKLSIKWYATGGVFDSPTIAGIGEAGPEAVAPIDVLQGYVADAVSSAVTTQELDYDRMGQAMAAAVSRLDLTMELNNREVGRMVRSYA